MKKLMFAAALCATVGLAYGSIESANIVGYQNKEVSANVGIAVDSFASIKAEVTSIDEFKVSAEGVAAGDVQIQTLTAFGATDRTFYWIPAAEAADYDMEGEGWFDADEWMPAEGVTFDPGEGFVTMSSTEGASVVFAGEVVSGATEVPVAQNVGIAGNATPVTIDIQSIVVNSETAAAGDVQIQTLTEFGATDRTFYWIPVAEAGDYDMEGEGWFDADEWVVAENVPFEAGEGFVTMCGVEDATLVIPSAL